MTLIIENGRVIDRTDKSIDALKRQQYGHSGEGTLLEEENAEMESFVDSLEPIEDGDEDTPLEADLAGDAVEIAMLYAEFKNVFVKTFGEENATEAFLMLDDFFKEKGVDTSFDLDIEDNVPGMESSEQSIMTSEVEES